MPTARVLRQCRFLPATLLVTVLTVPVWADDPTGAQIYQKLCVSCHGPDGQGTADNYPKPLVGDRSVNELTRFITKSMPEGEPELCVGEDARKVAQYIYDAFYSPMAQVRNKPPRIELSRLTVRQYENAIADLIGSFRGGHRWDERRGLEADYYNDRRARRDKRVIERVDARVKFNFGEASPDAEIGAEAFAINWEGSVLAPETGDYEFTVRTENAARLRVNGQSVVDAWVKSGNETEHRGTIRLLGGRVYPLRLEFFKFKEKTASIALEWKRPHQAPEVIPERYLSPNDASETLVIETPFPPDDRSMGYERGTSVSKAWEEATTYAAIEVANYVVAQLRELTGERRGDSNREAKVREFCHRFAERAFRRPLSDEQRQFYVDQHFSEARDLDSAVKRVVLLVLKSPRFLYRDLGEGLNDPYEVAARLSFGLWDSLPDQTLLDAAAKDELQTREQVLAQARRMVNDLRTQAKVRDFFHAWLKVDHIHDLSKDAELFPEFNAEIASDLRTSLDLFVDEIVWSEASDFRQLLLADEVYLNGRLAQFYGADLPADADFQKVPLDSEARAGVLTHPFLMSGFAYYSTSSPIHRGVFLARSLLGRVLMPPPEAVAPLPPDLHPGLTTRERTQLQTGGISCSRCHDLINPLGYSLEHFDAVGRYRTEEKGRPIDAAGLYETRSGETVKFAGAREMACFLADSEEVHQAFVEQLFHYLVQQPIVAFGAETSPRLRESFEKDNFNIRNLLVEIVTASALRPEAVQISKAGP